MANDFADAAGTASWEAGTKGISLFVEYIR